MDPQCHSSHLDEGGGEREGMEEERIWQEGGKKDQRNRRGNKSRRGGGELAWL